jgi:ABC-type proline/glycine betaine transport system ATPase subunit
MNFFLIPGSRPWVTIGAAGKSTVVALLLRFYVPEAGKILLDSVDIARLPVAWLRSQMGYDNVHAMSDIELTIVRLHLQLGGLLYKRKGPAGVR